MSVEAVNQFLQKVTEDQKIQEELTKILETKNNDRAAVTRLGTKYGYEFTPDELREAAAELSEEDLETVSGGAGGRRTVAGFNLLSNLFSLFNQQ